MAAVPEQVERKSEIELFEEFFEKQNGRPMNDEQRALSGRLLEKVREGMQ